MKTVSTTLACIVTFISLLCSSQANAEDQKLGLDISSAKIEVSTNEFSAKEEELTEYLKMVMKEYFVIPKDKWTHNYTHAALGDSTGTMDWSEDESKVWQWMIRTGGLASFTDENGITTYLAKVVN